MAMLSPIAYLMFFLMLGEACHALVVNGYNSNKHDRFLNLTTNPSHNPDFIHASVDLTGVGWYLAGIPTQRRGVTMVSPIHFVGANHAKPGIGASIHFLSSTGVVKTFTVASHSIITNSLNQDSDLMIGTLTSAIKSTDIISFHPYLNLSSNARYRNKPMLMLGKDGLGASQTVDRIGTLAAPPSINLTQALISEYDTNAPDADDAYFNNGDSGSPSFILQDGIAAIVGVHSLVSTNSNPILNYDSFVPHYISKLNSVMAQNGYRMTKAIPGSTTLDLDHELQAGIIRAGHPFTINLTINNVQSTLAENTKLINSFPSGTLVSSSGGNGWFDESTASLTKARRASIAGSSSSAYGLTLTIPNEGIAQHQVTFSCDQFAASTQSFNINVIGSFLSFTSGLTDTSSTGDDDHDGIINLLEYVFGGNPAVSSQFLPGTTTPLLPEFKQTGGVFQISYLRRKDYVTRAISYDLESSTTMATGTWSNATSLITKTTVSSVNTEFEKVTYELGGTASDRFFRIEVTLNE